MRSGLNVTQKVDQFLHNITGRDVEAEIKRKFVYACASSPTRAKFYSLYDEQLFQAVQPFQDSIQTQVAHLYHNQCALPKGAAELPLRVFAKIYALHPRDFVSLFRAYGHEVSVHRLVWALDSRRAVFETVLPQATLCKVFDEAFKSLLACTDDILPQFLLFRHQYQEYIFKARAYESEDIHLHNVFSMFSRTSLTALNRSFSSLNVTPSQRPEEPDSRTFVFHQLDAPPSP